MARALLVIFLGLAALVALASADAWVINLDDAARGTFTVDPASLLTAIGDTISWVWSTGTSIHSIAAENPLGPRCSSDPNRPFWFQPSPFWRGNNSVTVGLPRFTWTVTVGTPGNFPYQCPSNPPISSSFHCSSRDMRGNIVAYYPGVNNVWDVTVDPTAGTFTPSQLNIVQGDVVRWTWRRSTVTANIITEGTQFCSPYNTSTPANTTAKWAFVESPVFFNNGLWTPVWYVKFDTPGSFAYFAAENADFSRCRAGFRGVINVTGCTPNSNCQPNLTAYPTAVPIGQDPIDPNRRVSGVDNWVLWTAVAYLSVLGALLVATIVACVIGSKKSDGAMIAVCLLPSETPSWANVKV